MPLPRVLFLQPSAQPPGGGNGLIAWMIHALQDDYEVSLLSLERFEAESINRFYGTAIDASRVHAERVLPLLHGALARLPFPLALLKSSLLIRRLRDVQGAFDVVITANNEANLHRPGIQYVHYPTHLRPRPDVDLRDYHHELLMTPYYRLCTWLSGVTAEGIKRNLTLVNSDWTGAHMVAAYPGIATTTLYPPVAGEFPDVPWEEREEGFVAIGRLSPEKDYDRIFDILAGVRRTHPHIRLHLVCTRDMGNAYCRRILARAEAERSWVTVHDNIPRAELVRLMSRQRYGIHAMAEEHFGMGVAEMVRAGCLVWVPNGGGQVEIVGRDERLLYRDNDEAIAKITAALADEGLAQALRAHLAPYRERFSEKVFVARFRRLVDEFIAGRRASPAGPAGVAR